VRPSQIYGKQVILSPLPAEMAMYHGVSVEIATIDQFAVSIRDALVAIYKDAEQDIDLSTIEITTSRTAFNTLDVQVSVRGH
jgi:hypothetical protein